jgi:hypothetical protein
MLKFTVIAVLAFILCLSVVSATGIKKNNHHLLANKTLLKDGQSVFSQLCSIGFSHSAAAGIMGNICVETGGSYSYQQQQDGGGNGYGLFQFDFLKSYYFSWLSSTGRSDSAESQIYFVHSTIYGSQQYLIGAGKAAQIANGLTSSSVTSCCETFCSLWEQPGVPHLDRRISCAQQWAGQSC